MKSKFIGLEFDGWVVTSGTRCTSGHYRFWLTKKPTRENELAKSIVVRDNMLTKLVTGRKTMDELLIGKYYQVICRRNLPANRIYYC